MWTDADTEAYWEEIRREERGYKFTVGGKASDPFGPRFGKLTYPEPEPEPEPVVPRRARREDPDRVFWGAVSMLPDRDREAFATAYGPMSVQGKGGRSGDGVACSVALGIPQSTWVCRLNTAERRLALVAPHARKAGGYWNKDKLLASLPEGVVRAVVDAYLNSWSSLQAARDTGVWQSTAWGRLTKAAKLNPVFATILHRREPRLQ